MSPKCNRNPAFETFYGANKFIFWVILRHDVGPYIPQQLQGWRMEQQQKTVMSNSPDRVYEFMYNMSNSGDSLDNVTVYLPAAAFSLSLSLGT